jgi:acetyl esterase/lipase
MKPMHISYGHDRAQTAELWLPGEEPHVLPVVVLLHGGFWRQMYTKRLMHGFARGLVPEGWAVLNVEYRRVGWGGSGGWPETFEDVSGAVDALAGLDRIDLATVVTMGHSAGGHLALWLAGPRITSLTSPREHAVRVSAAISLAGIPNLQAASHAGLGNGAVDALMHGSPEQYPEDYQLASPESQLPLRVRQFVIHGEADSTVPLASSVSYVAAARAAGDDVTLVPVSAATHMDMIRTKGRTFDEVKAVLSQLRPR